MKLLFDENVSPKLPDHLAAEYPESVHVRGVGLRGANDQQIWDYARVHELAIVSKATDFRERSYVEGFPPKIIWLDVGNAGTVFDRGVAAARTRPRRTLRDVNRGVRTCSFNREQRGLTGARITEETSFMPNATISVDATLKARLADLASQTGQQVDEFVEALLRRIADADVRFERGVPVLPRRPGAPTVTVEDVDRILDGDV